MANVYRLEPANVSGAGIVFGVFAALVTQLMLSLLIVGLGLTAADTAAVAAPGTPQETGAVAWSAFAGWTITGIIGAFVGGAVAGWMAGAVDGSPGFHGLATWAITTVVVAVAAGLLAGTGSAVAAMAGPYFDTPARGQFSPAELEAAANTAGVMALASFVALALGAIAAYLGAQMAAHREVSLHPHTEHRV